MTDPPTRVLIVDDQQLVRSGFRMILDSAEGIAVVGEADTGAGAVTVATQLRPDVIVMDVRMPVMDGIEATRQIRSTMDADAPRVLILTTFDLDEYVFAALRAGASGFLLKDARPPELVAAVRTIAHGDALLAPSVTRRLIERHVSVATTATTDPAHVARLDALTARESDVLQLVAAGCSNAEIAGRLFLSEATVKSHVTRMLAKLGVRDRVQAVVFAYESALVVPGRTTRP